VVQHFPILLPWDLIVFEYSYVKLTVNPFRSQGFNPGLAWSVLAVLWCRRKLHGFDYPDERYPDERHFDDLVKLLDRL